MNDMQIIEELLKLVNGRVKTSHYNLADWIGTPSEAEYRGYVKKWDDIVMWLEQKKREQQGLCDTTEGK